MRRRSSDRRSPRGWHRGCLPSYRVLVALALACLPAAARAEDKPAPVQTIGPPVELSLKQKADIAAEMHLVTPAPSTVVAAPRAPKPFEPSAAAPRATPVLVPIAAGSQAPSSAEVPAFARRLIAPTSHWVVSPAIGRIPRAEWMFPALFRKSADCAWIGTGEAGHAAPVTPAFARPMAPAAAPAHTGGQR